MAPVGATNCPVSTQGGNPSSYKAVIEANQSGRPAVEKLEPFHPGLVVIVAVRGLSQRRSVYTPYSTAGNNQTDPSVAGYPATTGAGITGRGPRRLTKANRTRSGTHLGRP